MSKRGKVYCGNNILSFFEKTEVETKVGIQLLSVQNLCETRFSNASSFFTSSFTSRLSTTLHVFSKLFITFFLFLLDYSNSRGAKIATGSLQVRFGNHFEAAEFSNLDGCKTSWSLAIANKLERRTDFFFAGMAWYWLGVHLEKFATCRAHFKKAWS